MVQRLLADRFNLSVRFETRSRPGRVLTMARSDGRSGENANAPENQPDACLGITSTNGKTRVVGHAMERFPELLSNMLSAEPMIDRTGLNGPPM